MPLNAHRADIRSLAGTLPIMMWQADKDLRRTFLNAEWLKFRGRALERESGDGWFSGVHPEDLERLSGIFQGAGEAPFEFIYRIQRSDGEYRHVLDRATPVHDEDGSLSGYVGVSVDVTEAIAMQSAALESARHDLAELNRLLPVCTRCKRIRDDDAYWLRLEEFISAHTPASPSASEGCPDCGGRQSDPPKADSHGPTVLVVDDEPGIRALISEVLTNAGYQPIEAGNGKQAIDVVRAHTHKISTLITDLCMPDFDGLELLMEVLREREPFGIVAISGADQGLYLGVARKLGATVTLGKPFTPAQLLDAVERACAVMPVG